MRLLFAALALCLLFLPVNVCGQLAELYPEDVHMEVGKSVIVKTHISNPDNSFASISVWLGGDYPAGLAKFASQSGIAYTADMRNVTIQLNPGEEKILNLVIYSTEPKAGGYLITIDAKTTASSLQDFDSMKVSVDRTPTFPGIEAWGILLVIGIAGLSFWRLHPKN
jgi:hypothetical protein